MKFITNSIRTGKTKSFADLISEYKKSNAPRVKVASSSKEKIVTAESEKDEADSSGQLEVEPLHQEGESTPSPSKKKEVKKAKDACDKDNENKTDAEDSEQSSWEGKKKNNNDPQAGKHRDGDQKKAQSNRFIKISNLDEKSKDLLRKYWSKIYPKDFVDAMLADK